MKHRWTLAAVGVLAAGGAYWLSRSSEGEAARAPSSRTAKIEAPIRRVEPGAPAEAPPAKEPVKMVMTESGLRPMTARQPREKIDPRNGSTMREIVDSVPDSAAAAREELTYRKQRLRLTLSDEAAACWGGGDEKDEIELEYTLVVQNEVIRTENVRVKQSGIKNPTVERCIIDAVRDLRSFAEKIPDMREEQGLIMSLHDLYARNRSTRPNKSEPDQPDPADRPTAVPPGK
jgi:hypothetical protein